MINEKIEIEGLIFHLHRHDESEYQVLNEGDQKGRHLIGNYYYDIHQPHNSTGEYHIHLRDKSNEILSMNRGGSAHDGYHGAKFPGKAFKALQKKFPDWKWPKNRIIESAEFTYLLDGNSGRSLRPVKVMKHRDYNLNDVLAFTGFFHQFGQDAFLAGASGWVERTVALIETEDGWIKKVPVGCFRFLDLE